MWRQEERLSFWLGGASSSQRPGFALRARNSIARKIGILHCRHAVRGQSLSISAHVTDQQDALELAASVKDGLGILLRHWDASNESRDRAGKFIFAIHNLDFLDEADVQNLELPENSNVGVKWADLELSAGSRSLPLTIRKKRLHSLPCFQDKPVQVHSGKRHLRMNARIGTVMKPISDLPQMRISVEIDNLAHSERQSFLREAEVLKRIPSERAELMAVFRHVPIEVISQLRLLAEKRVLLFTISEGARTSTRVHDMAAVRDKASKEIYMIPHRTRYRSVSLN
jgi:hypothetical protein